MIRRLLSYIYPIRILRTESDISNSLELTWVNGKLLLDSENANYSYGSLERVLRYGLKSIGKDKISKMHNILVLGVAGGSVIKLLVNEMGFKGSIVGVDIDPEVIDLAKKYFHLDKIPNLELVVDDAAEFVKSTERHFDLIIIDIFRDKFMPDFLYDPEFVLLSALLLEKDGFILFNTIVLDNRQQKKNNQYSSQFPNDGFTVSVLPKVQQFNELILVQKH